MSKIKTVLQFEKQKPVSPWRTDIENAPRDESDILAVIGDFNYVLHYYHNKLGEAIGDFRVWHSDEWSYKDEDITHWMPIPELPKL
mgnify:CR=1 FL=1